MGNLSISTGSTSLTQPLMAGCYEYSCTYTGVYVTIGDSVYHCSERGEVLSVQEQVGVITYSLSLVCPACETICWDRTELCQEGGLPTNNPENTGTALERSTVLFLVTTLTSILLLF